MRDNIFQTLDLLYHTFYHFEINFKIINQVILLEDAKYIPHIAHHEEKEYHGTYREICKGQTKY